MRSHPAGYLPFAITRLIAMFATSAMLAPASVRAASYVLPHWIEHSGSTGSSTYVFDDYVYLRYTPGLAGTASGGGATVDLYLYDGSMGNPLTIYGTQVCNPCSFDVGGGAPRNVAAEIGQIIAARTGFATPVYTGYAILVVRGAHPAGVTIENDLVNSHSDPFDLAVVASPPLRLRSEDPVLPGARVFSIPHMLETSGSTSSTPYTFDETLFATYTGGQAGTPGTGGATVSLYLYDESTGVPLANHGLTVCAPCTYNLGGVNPRKVAIRLEDLIVAAGGSFDVPVKRAAGVVVVSGADPGNVTLQPWLINAHSNPFDLALTAQVAQPIAGAGFLAVADDREGVVSALHVAPNPAAGVVRIGFELAASGDVELAIFDLAGRERAKVFRGRTGPGEHELSWDGRDKAGQPVEGGIYFARLKAADRSIMSRVIMLP